MRKVELVEHILKTRPYKCENCGIELTGEEKIKGTKYNNPNLRSLHHKVPIRYGGKDEDKNIDLLCWKCHMFLETRIKIVEEIMENKFKQSKTGYINHIKALEIKLKNGNN